MTTVGVRELKNRLSHYLDLARNGESITVTARGQEIAVILPVARSEEEELVARLIKEGKATWGGGKPRGASHCVHWPGKPLSEIVIEDRG